MFQTWFHELHVRMRLAKCAGHLADSLAGRRERPSGEVYWGEFENGRYHGRGVLELPDKSIYRGQFVMGKYEGRQRSRPLLSALAATLSLPRVSAHMPLAYPHGGRWWSCV